MQDTYSWCGAWLSTRTTLHLPFNHPTTFHPTLFSTSIRFWPCQRWGMEKTQGKDFHWIQPNWESKCLAQWSLSPSVIQYWWHVYSGCCRRHPQVFILEWVLPAVSPSWLLSWRVLMGRSYGQDVTWPREVSTSDWTHCGPYMGQCSRHNWDSCRVPKSSVSQQCCPSGYCWEIH